MFILVIAAGAAAGTPLHSHEQECGVGGTAEVDCCEKAREQSGSPEVLAARLCCALNCSQPAPTGPAGVYSSQSVQPHATSPLLAAATRPANLLPPSLQHRRAQVLALGFPPGYIRHSALLI